MDDILKTKTKCEWHFKVQSKHGQYLKTEVETIAPYIDFLKKIDPLKY